jgi:hypothetical protein
VCRDGLDVVEKRKILPCRKSNPVSPDCTSVIILIKLRKKRGRKNKERRTDGR